MITDTTFLAQGKNDPTARVERIRQAFRNAADSFIVAGLDLRAAYRAEEWNALGLKNFGEYCGQFDMSDSWAYDLIRIADIAESFPDYRARMLDIGISKMRLLAARMENGDETQVDTLLDMASEKSWNELRRELNTGERDAPLSPVLCPCPACGAVLEMSRAARLQIAD